MLADLLIAFFARAPSQIQIPSRRVSPVTRSMCGGCNSRRLRSLQALRRCAVSQGRAQDFPFRAEQRQICGARHTHVRITDTEYVRDLCTATNRALVKPENEILDTSCAVERVSRNSQFSYRLFFFLSLRDFMTSNFSWIGLAWLLFRAFTHGLLGGLARSYIGMGTGSCAALRFGLCCATDKAAFGCRR